MLIVCPNCDSSFELDSSLLEPSGRQLECSECSHGWFCGSDGLPGEDPSSSSDVVAEKESASAVAEGIAGVSPTGDDEDSEGDRSRDVAEALSALDEDEDSVVGDDSSTASMDVEGSGLSDDEEEEEEEDGEDGEDDDLEAKIQEHEARIRQRRRRRGGGGGSRIFGWLVLLAFLGGGAWASYQYRNEVVAYYPPAVDIYYRLGLMRPLGEGLKILPARTETLESSKGEKTLLVVGEIYNTLTGSQDVLEIPLLRGSLIDGNDREVRVWTFQATQDRILPNERVTYRTEIGDPPSNVRALVITFARPGED